MAETDGNRTRQAEILNFTGFEDQGAHQDTYASVGHTTKGLKHPLTLVPTLGRMTDVNLDNIALTSFAAGGGCACKIPPGQLEDVVKDLVGVHDPNVLVGLDDGDDAAAIRINDNQAVISTTDFFTPVVNDPYDWGRIAATNALSDIYAMGGTPITTINIVGWPQDTLPLEILREVLRGGMDVATAANIAVTGGHSIKRPSRSMARPRPV